MKHLKSQMIPRIPGLATLLVAVVIAFGNETFASSPTSRAEPSPKGNLALVFKGPTICDGCETAVADLIKGRGLEVRYVLPGETTPELLRQAAIYIVPGGEDVDAVNQAWNSAEIGAIREYVRAGGRYFGVCLGGYWAGDWPGSKPGLGFQSLGIIPGKVVQYDADPKDRVEEIYWEGERRESYFQDGPGFVINDLSKTHVFATYKDGVATTFISEFGKGRVAISGVHVEATRDWYSDSGLKIPGHRSMVLGQELMDALFSDIPIPHLGAFHAAWEAGTSVRLTEAKMKPYDEAIGREKQGYNNNLYVKYFERLNSALKLQRPEQDWLLDEHMFLLSQNAIVNRAVPTQDDKKRGQMMLKSSLGLELPVGMFDLFYKQLKMTYVKRLNLTESMADALIQPIEQQALQLAGVDVRNYRAIVGRRAWDRRAQKLEIARAQKWMWNTTTIDPRFDVPFVAGYEKNDGHYIYMDRNVPEVENFEGQDIPVWKLLDVHEAIEKALLDELGLVYLSAHQIALRTELQTALALGVSWKVYDRLMVKTIAEMARKKLTKVSDRLQMLPYYTYRDPGDQALVEGMKAVMVNEPLLVSKRMMCRDLFLPVKR